MAGSSSTQIHPIEASNLQAPKPCSTCLTQTSSANYLPLVCSYDAKHCSAQNPASHLLLGHICATFGPDEARLFWQRVIGEDTANVPAEANGNGERRIMLRNSPQSPAPPRAMPGVIGCWVVDYAPLFHLGPVVPQQPYVPSGTIHQIALHYQGLCAPIWFVNTNGTVGISLVDALSGRTDTLRGNESLVPETRQTTHIEGTAQVCNQRSNSNSISSESCQQWPGYPEFEKLVNMYDSRRDSGVRYGQLARKVSNFVEDFLDVRPSYLREHITESF